jgi:hypothetical protein
MQHSPPRLTSKTLSGNSLFPLGYNRNYG